MTSDGRLAVVAVGGNSLITDAEHVAIPHQAEARFGVPQWNWPSSSVARTASSAEDSKGSREYLGLGAGLPPPRPPGATPPGGPACALPIPGPAAGDTIPGPGAVGGCVLVGGGAREAACGCVPL